MSDKSLASESGSPAKYLRARHHARHDDTSDYTLWTMGYVAETAPFVYAQPRLLVMIQLVLCAMSMHAVLFAGGCICRPGAVVGLLTKS